MADVSRLFRRDSTTHAASVEAWVVLTTALLLAKFAVGSVGPWFSSRRLVAAGIQLLNILNYYTVSYTLGLMGTSSFSSSGSESDTAAASDFFQVWAVLVVIMQDGVKIGRPYRPKEMTLIDLLSSLWSANMLRKQTRVHLKVPLWCMWSIHASRVVWYYVSSSRATEACVSNIRLVSDYMMSSLHTDEDASPSTMSGYRYIVVGEEEQKMDVEPPCFRLEMDLTAPGAAQQLLTVHEVWEQAGDTGDRLLSTAADSDNQFKDVCLSFALYKLQRRRFFDFPIAEATHPASRRLVAEVVTSHERALLSVAHEIWQDYTNISEGAQLKVLVDAKLKEEFPPAILEDNGYFQGYERHFEWHFDTDYKYFECVGLQDYQRLALNKDFDYLDWDEYQTYNTYQGDKEFIEFYEKLSSKAKWFGFPEVDCHYERRRYQRLAFYQAVKIAAGYNNISRSLLYTGFSDFLWSINHDADIYKEIANFYFEIWKRIAKEKQVYDQGICARCPFNMKLVLARDPGSSRMKINYDTYVAVISGEVQENEGRLMIAEAVKKFVHKRKIYYDYARKKLDIARKIGVIPLQDMHTLVHT